MPLIVSWLVQLSPPELAVELCRSELLDMLRTMMALGVCGGGGDSRAFWCLGAKGFGVAGGVRSRIRSCSKSR
jgi:hypothetical protein